MPQLWLILNTEHQASGNVERRADNDERPSTIDTNTPPVCETLAEEEEAAAANSTAPTNGQLCARCALRFPLCTLPVGSWPVCASWCCPLPVARCCTLPAASIDCCCNPCLTFSTVDGPAITLQMGEIV